MLDHNIKQNFPSYLFKITLFFALSKVPAHSCKQRGVNKGARFFIINKLR